MPGAPVTGEKVVGLSVATALQLSVGLPVVPGGHTQRGLWPMVWQSALSPHRPG